MQQPLISFIDVILLSIILFLFLFLLIKNQYRSRHEKNTNLESQDHPFEILHDYKHSNTIFAVKIILTIFLLIASWYIVKLVYVQIINLPVFLIIAINITIFSLFLFIFSLIVNLNSYHFSKFGKTKVNIAEIRKKERLIEFSNKNGINSIPILKKQTENDELSNAQINFINEEMNSQLSLPIATQKKDIGMDQNARFYKILSIWTMLFNFLMIGISMVGWIITIFLTPKGFDQLDFIAQSNFIMVVVFIETVLAFKRDITYLDPNLRERKYYECFFYGLSMAIIQAIWFFHGLSLFLPFYLYFSGLSFIGYLMKSLNAIIYIGLLNQKSDIKSTSLLKQLDRAAFFIFALIMKIMFLGYKLNLRSFENERGFIDFSSLDDMIWYSLKAIYFTIFSFFVIYFIYHLCISRYIQKNQPSQAKISLLINIVLYIFSKLPVLFAAFPEIEKFSNFSLWGLLISFIFALPEFIDALLEIFRKRDWNYFREHSKYKKKEIRGVKIGYTKKELEDHIISNVVRKNKIHAIALGNADNFSANIMTNNLKTLQISTTQTFANYKSRVAEIFFDKNHPKQRIRIRFSILTFLPVIIGFLLGLFLLLIVYFNMYGTLFVNGLFGELASNSIPNIEKIRKMRVIQFSFECIFFSGLLFIIDELFINDQIRKGRINSVYLLNGGCGIGIIFYSIANIVLEVRGNDPFILILSAKIIFMIIGIIYLIKSSFLKETFYLESKTPSPPPNNIELLQQVNYIRSFFMLCILFLLIDDLRIMQFYFHYDQFVINIPYILRDLTYIIASTLLTNYLLLIGIAIELFLFFIVTAKIFDEKTSQINKPLLIILNILLIFYFGYGLFLFPLVFFLFYPEKLKILIPLPQRDEDQKKEKPSKHTTPSPKLNETEREIPAADILNAERPIEIQQIVSDLENPLTTIELEPVSEITFEDNSELLDHQNSQKESILGSSIEESIEELNVKTEPPEFNNRDEVLTTPEDKMDYQKEEKIPPNHEKSAIIESSPQKNDLESIIEPNYVYSHTEDHKSASKNSYFFPTPLLVAIFGDSCFQVSENTFQNPTDHTNSIDQFEEQLDGQSNGKSEQKERVRQEIDKRITNRMKPRDEENFNENAFSRGGESRIKSLKIISFLTLLLSGISGLIGLIQIYVYHQHYCDYDAFDAWSLGHFALPLSIMLAIYCYKRNLKPAINVTLAIVIGYEIIEYFMAAYVGTYYSIQWMIEIYCEGLVNIVTDIFLGVIGICVGVYLSEGDIKNDLSSIKKLVQESAHIKIPAEIKIAFGLMMSIMCGGILISIDSQNGKWVLFITLLVLFLTLLSVLGKDESLGLFAAITIPFFVMGIIHFSIGDYLFFFLEMIIGFIGLYVIFTRKLKWTMVLLSGLLYLGLIYLLSFSFIPELLSDHTSIISDAGVFLIYLVSPFLIARIVYQFNPDYTFQIKTTRKELLEDDISILQQKIFTKWGKNNITCNLDLFLLISIGVIVGFVRSILFNSILFLFDPFMWLLIAGCIAWVFNSSTLSSIVVSQLPWLFIVLIINIFVLSWFSAIYVFAIVFIGLYLLLIKKTASWAKVLVFGQIFILLFLALVTDSMQMDLAVLDVIVVLFFMVVGMSVITYYVQHLKEQQLNSSLVSYKLNGEITESSDFFDEKEQLIQDAAQIAGVFCNEIKNYQSLADHLVQNTSEHTTEIMHNTLEWMKNKPILMTTGAYTWLSMQPIFSEIQHKGIDKNFILIPTENYDENLVREILKTYYLTPKTLELSKSMGYCSAANCDQIILPDMDWLFLEDIIFESHPEFNFKFVFLPFMIPKINYENLNKAQHASREIATLEKLLTHEELKPFSNQNSAKINITHRIRTNSISSDQKNTQNKIYEINPTEIDPLVPNNNNIRSNSQKTISISTIIAQTVFILITAAVLYFIFEKMEIAPVIYFYRVPLLTIGESLIAMIIAFTFIITFAQIIYYSLAKYKIGGLA